MNNELERQVLKTFFEKVSIIEDIDSEISESKIVRTTQNQLKKILFGIQRCTCIRRTWGGICEVCQVSDREMLYLRNFYNNIRNAKKSGITSVQIKDFIDNVKKIYNNSDGKNYT